MIWLSDIGLTVAVRCDISYREWCSQPVRPDIRDSYFGFSLKTRIKTEILLSCCWLVDHQQSERVELHPGDSWADHLLLRYTKMLTSQISEMSSRARPWMESNFCQTATWRFVVSSCQYQNDWVIAHLAAEWEDMNGMTDVLLFLFLFSKHSPPSRMSYFGPPSPRLSDPHKLFPYSAVIARISFRPLLASHYIEVSARAVLYQQIKSNILLKTWRTLYL